VDGFLRKIMKTSSTWDYLNSESGILDNAYWGVNEDDASVDVSSQSVVIFDNTFNTNRYGYKLGFFSVVDRQGRTRIKAATLMQRETVESFKWVLGVLFRDLRNKAPRVVLTDGDLWMAVAIDAVLGAGSRLPTDSQTVHLLCTWHLSKTVFRHVRPCFGARDLKQWSRFLHRWWKLCQRSDVATRATFDAQWCGLKTHLRALLSERQRESLAFLHALGFLGGGLAEWEEELTVDGEETIQPNLSDFPEGERGRFGTL
jgi:hypothetical protein